MIAFPGPQRRPQPAQQPQRPGFVQRVWGRIRAWRQRRVNQRGQRAAYAAMIQDVAKMPYPSRAAYLLSVLKQEGVIADWAVDRARNKVVLQLGGGGDEAEKAARIKQVFQQFNLAERPNERERRNVGNLGMLGVHHDLNTPGIVQLHPDGTNTHHFIPFMDLLEHL